MPTGWKNLSRPLDMLVTEKWQYNGNPIFWKDLLFKKIKSVDDITVLYEKACFLKAKAEH